MTTMASLITSLAVVYSIVYSRTDQRKHQSSASLALVRGIHRDRWISRTKGQQRGKCFHLMTSSWEAGALVLEWQAINSHSPDSISLVPCRPSNFTAWWRHQMETFSALLAIVRGIHRSPANSPHKGQWREALMFSLICARINDWVNNGEAGDLIRNCVHYDVTKMIHFRKDYSRCKQFPVLKVNFEKQFIHSSKYDNSEQSLI